VGAARGVVGSSAATAVASTLPIGGPSRLARLLWPLYRRFPQAGHFLQASNLMVPCVDYDKAVKRNSLKRNSLWT